MSLEEVAEYAFSTEDDQPESAIAQVPSIYDEQMEHLTRREREVAILLAHGLTNRQIASELSISERTAENHVARILKKLELHMRAQIASRASEGQLLTPEQG